MTSDPSRIERLSFWNRQFAPTPTQKQITFDILFGVILPILCIYLDPIVFRRGDFLATKSMLPQYAIFAYLFIGLNVVLLLIETIARTRSSFMAGGLLAGGVFAFILGAKILPYSIIGLFMVIGILGFVPFFTGFVYFRSFYRIFELKVKNFSVLVIPLMLLGAFLTVSIPYEAHRVLNDRMDRAFERLVCGDELKEKEAVNTLKGMCGLVDTDRLIFTYRREKDSQKQKKIADSYEQLTGETIFNRMGRIMD